VQYVFSANIEGEEVARRTRPTTSYLTVESSDQAKIGQRLENSTAVSRGVRVEVQCLDLAASRQMHSFQRGENP